MKKNRETTPEAFERMLLWLDKDRDIAGQKYEAIRFRLIKIFDHRQCSNSEELSDIVFDRVLKKIDENAVTNNDNPALYFYKVANNIFRENLRKPVTVEVSEDIAVKEDEEGFDPYYECLKKCLENLSAEHHKLIVNYYEEEKREKISYHKQLAKSFGIKLNILHLHAFRIRKRLQKCVLRCVEGQS